MLLHYYVLFCVNYALFLTWPNSVVLGLLTLLLKFNSKSYFIGIYFTWTKDHNQAFCHMKQACASVPVLGLINYPLLFPIFCHEHDTLWYPSSTLWQLTSPGGVLQL